MEGSGNRAAVEESDPSDGREPGTAATTTGAGAVLRDGGGGDGGSGGTKPGVGVRGAGAARAGLAGGACGEGMCNLTHNANLAIMLPFPITITVRGRKGLL